MDDNNSAERRNRKDKLLGYYKTQMNQSEPKIDPIYDLDSQDFDYNAYLKKILKEERLSNLMDKEKEMLDQIRNLDSEMQTLVYDNYNKFIYATDTIRNMKSDFKYVEEEMRLLGTKISEVSTIADKLHSDLNPRRDQLKKLAGTHQLLKRLEYLFELPARLRSNIDARQYLAAVRSHSKAQSVLDRYQDLPSFEGIRRDCDDIIKELRAHLWTRFDDLSIEIQELSSTVMILGQLHEPRGLLATKFLAHCSMVTEGALQSLREQLHVSDNDDDKNPFVPDILHVANITTELVLDKLSSHITVYTELFLQETDCDETPYLHVQSSSDPQNGSKEALRKDLSEALLEYIAALMPPFLAIVHERLDHEKTMGDTTMLARAMDRIHSRLQALGKLVPLAEPGSRGGAVDLAGTGLALVCRVSHDRCLFFAGLLARQLAECVTDIRQRLAASTVGSGGALASLTAEGGAPRPAGPMFQLQQSLSDALVDQLKATLNAQQAFIATDNTFSKKQMFQVNFCLKDIRETLFVGFVENIISFCNDLANKGTSGASFCPLLLILARLCQNWADEGTLDYLLTIVDEQFLITTIKAPEGEVRLTPVEHLCGHLRQACLNLTNAYVRVQGTSLSQMIRKSVDTRDWLNCVEPRSVRSVMKRVVEDMAQIDTQVSQLLPSKRTGGGEASSDSSRRQGAPAPWSFAPASSSRNIGSDRFLSNLTKLFADKIHIFAPVVAARESVLAGVVRIGLKTFMECVRLKTFGRFGLQQVQVDCGYLQVHLWRFVADEGLVRTLLDDVVCSVYQRCVDPVPMEASIVEAICEE